MQHARSMLCIVQRARKQGATTYRDLADWLNSRDYKTRRGKVWRHQTVWEMLHIDHGQIAQAEAERAKKLAMISFRERRLLPEDRLALHDAFAAERRGVEEQFKLEAFEARLLGAALRDEARQLPNYDREQ